VYMFQSQSTDGAIYLLTFVNDWATSGSS